MRVLHIGDDFAALRPCGLTLYSDALMRAQSARGHQVSYLFSGRHYPLLRGPRLKRWWNGAIRMYELIGSPNYSHWETGTRRPERDLEEPAGETAFAAALRDAHPDIIHVHELARLPSAIIEQAKDARLPVVMTLHDYKPVCASVRLLDADGKRCTRKEVGEDCARNCAGAPEGAGHLLDLTLHYERRRLKRAIPLADKIDFTRVGPLVGRATRLLHGASPPAVDGNRSGAASRPAPGGAGYQRRRDVNVRRLGLCDRLLAPSARVAEIYAALGVDKGRLSVHRLTMPHLEGLFPRRDPAVRRPLTFLTLGGCASVSKGSHVIVEAVDALEQAGRAGDYRLLVFGHVEAMASKELSRTPSVTLAGGYAPAELDNLLEQGDVGLVPSVWEETHGFVGVEMLAKGLPVIGSALGGIPEYVRQDETGWLNRSATGAELATLMAQAIDRPEEVERLRRSVRARRAEIITPMSEHVNEVEAIYAELNRTPP